MIITGTPSDDILYDAAKRDQLTGGLGADIFVLQKDGKRDTVMDFEDGVDVVDFTDFDVTFEELFIFQINTYSFIIEIRGEKNQIDVVPPNIGDPPITPWSFTTEDFIFAAGAAPPNVVLQADTTGADKLIGTGRPDVFLFNPDGLRDAIRRFEIGKDKIDLTTFDTSFGNLVFVDRADGRVSIQLETVEFGLERLVVNDKSKLFTAADFTADDFIFA